jgi:methylaspartate ammonia-lyase
MTAIERVLAVPAVGAGYYEDLTALEAQHIGLPERFTAEPVTPGFRAVREVAEAVSVGLVLDTGQIAWGDCVSVSYSGRAGRWPVFRTEGGVEAIQGIVAPALEGRELAAFRPLAAEVDALVLPVADKPSVDEAPVADPARRALLTALPRALRRGDDAQPQSPVPGALHPAIRYGASQALLQAVALARGITMAEVVAAEWGLASPSAPAPIHAQSGHERYYNAEKMIVRRIASLPHALMDDLVTQVGRDGGELTRYIRWLAGRIGELGGPDYQPTIHLDIYGALGQICDHQPGKMLGRLFAWQTAAEPYPLRIECPVLMDSREAQIEMMHTLCDYIRLRRMTVRLVADEWANTLDDIHAFVQAGAAHMVQIKMPDLGSIDNAVEAVLACKAGGVGAFLGGSYAETDLSARISAHVALATQADALMAKPGMGGDEAISLVQNEMARTLAVVRLHAVRPIR